MSGARPWTARRTAGPAVTVAWIVAMWLQAAGPPLAAQMATADRVREPGWWPTKGDVAPDDYVGPLVCAQCHGARAATQSGTAMAQTARRAADSDVLRAHDRLTFRRGDYTYELATAAGRSFYAVSGGGRTLAVPVDWALGAGRIGQTYIFEREGTFHESRVSYFDTLRALDFTPARALDAPGSVEEAAGRPMTDAEARRCFGCHMTGSTTGRGFDPAGAIAGVTCEACHGPGRAHAAAMARGAPPDPDVSRDVTLRLALSPADSVDFCGACHATFWDVTLAGEQGIAALRSQPFRLQGSRCWGEGDERITCVACHDPHRPLVRGTRAYDPQCLSCHTAAGAPPTAARAAGACPVAPDDCASCHMPKYDVPEMHFRFTDHLIRVVRAR